MIFEILHRIRQGTFISKAQSEYLDDFPFERLHTIVYVRTGVGLDFCYGHNTPYPAYQLTECCDSEVYSNHWTDSHHYVTVQDDDRPCDRNDASRGPDEYWYTVSYIEDHTSFCTNCDGLCWSDDLDDDGNCGCCAEELAESGGPIYDYNANILNVLGYRYFVNNKQHAFPTNKALIYGVELETEANNRVSDLHQLDDHSHIILKHDGSLNNGAEIVTLPMDLASHKSTMPWPQLLEDARKVARSRRTCGMHIHINRAALSELTLSKFLFFINHHTHEDFVNHIAQRVVSECHYCRTKLNQAPIANIGKQHKNEGRYSAVNLENSGTIELRIFAANLRLERVYKNLEFTDALVHYCQETSIQNITVDSFIKYAVSRKRTYPNLVAFMVERNLTQLPAKKQTRKEELPLCA